MAKRKHWWIIVTRDCHFPCGAFPFMTREKARDRKREFNSTIYKVIKVVEAGTEIECW